MAARWSGDVGPRPDEPSLPSPAANPESLARAVKDAARALGFDACGVAAVADEADDGFDAWLDAGHAAGMDWMRRTRDLRQNAALKLPGVRSVVAVAAGYAQPRPPTPPDHGKVALYASFRDYHRVLLPRVRLLGGRLTELAPGTEHYACVDSGPVRERAWAARAGLGWIGKNSLLLHRELGSWLFLGALLTTAELAPDTPAADRCGTCRACLDACPTGAIVAPRVVDSNRCIAYHTIENKGAVPGEVGGRAGDWVFGCDVCQEACPWNRRAPETTEPDFRLRPGVAAPPLDELAGMDEETFGARFNGTPVRRAGLEGMRRNARAVLRNRGDS